MSETTESQKRKRLPRAAIACEVCRVRKARCDQAEPCSYCARHSLECTYRAAISPHPRTFPATNINASSPSNSLQSRLDTTTGEPPFKIQRYGTPSAQQYPSRRQSEVLPTESPRNVPIVPRHGTRDASSTPVYYGAIGDKFRQETNIAGNERAQESPFNRLPKAQELSVGPTQTGTMEDTTVEENEDTVDELNVHTDGREFYGATGTFSFLSRLRARARSYNTTRNSGHDAAAVSGSGAGVGHEVRTMPLQKVSIVNFFHSADGQTSRAPSEGAPQYTEAVAEAYDRKRGVAADLNSTVQDNLPATLAPSTSRGLQPYEKAFNGSAILPPIFAPAEYPPRRASEPTQDSLSRLHDLQVERECVQAFFEGLHLVHPFLNKESFLKRCEQEVWKNESRTLTSRESHRRSTFLALYNTVLAVGIITSGEIGSSTQQRDAGSLGQGPPTVTHDSEKGTIHPPLKLAKLFFERAKACLGDVFEVCSLESTQCLFLMSVFCQNALKPHSCYMYSGMAARTALAIGLPSEVRSRHVAEASNLWWSIYSHEVEMCSSSGRDTMLKDPKDYAVPLPDQLDHEISNPQHPTMIFRKFITVLVSFAHLQRRAFNEIYGPGAAAPASQKSRVALILDECLVQWRSRLSPTFDISKTSLTEPEFITKQKIVLEIRFLNARILIHRPFLVAASNQRHETDSEDSMNVALCIEASVKTIQIIYDTYLHRPFFRRWWYNTTYTLYSAVVLLYAVFSDTHRGHRQSHKNTSSYSDPHVLLAEVEKSIEIFRSMEVVVVARRCAELIQELLDIARTYVRDQENASAALSTSAHNEASDSQSNTQPFPFSNNINNSNNNNNNDLDMSHQQHQIHSAPSSMPTNIMASLLDFDSSWSHNSAAADFYGANGGPSSIGADSSNNDFWMHQLEDNGIFGGDTIGNGGMNGLGGWERGVAEYFSGFSAL